MDTSASLREKIATVATKVYGADGLEYSAQLDTYEWAGRGIVLISSLGQPAWQFLDRTAWPPSAIILSSLSRPGGAA
jgi:hypothetical protein